MQFETQLTDRPSLKEGCDMQRFSGLQRRVTHKYVGTYQHEDEWEDLGRVYTLAEGEPQYPEGDNLEDGYTQKIFVRVELHDGVDADVSDIRRALNDCYTMWGCSHDYDCCGCRSYMGSATHIKDDLWMVDVHSSRNF